MFDAKALGEEVVRSVRDFCTRAIAPVTERIDAIELQVRELPEMNAELEATRAFVVKQFREAVDALPTPKNGEDGKSIDHAELASEIAKAASLIVASLPVPKDGKDADPEVVKTLVQEQVDKALTANQQRDADELREFTSELIARFESAANAG